MLFDCDGVLVDSEAITNGVLRDMLEEMGWQLSLQECMRIFVGKAVKDATNRSTCSCISTPDSSRASS